jgi:hypothetical protein
MSIGANVSVITVGAVLAFATRIHSTGISVEALGAVLMAVGAVSLALRLVALVKQRRLTTAQAGTMPADPVANPYTGTTSDPLPPYDSVYQPTGERIGNER